MVSSLLIYPELWGWSLSKIALYIAIISFCSIPVLPFIRNQFTTYQHSRIIVIGMLFCMIGAITLINFGRMLEWQFYTGSLILFAATTTIGGVSDVLNSKILPLQLSRGVFNSGLIATLAGAFGRSVGGFTVGWVGFANARLTQDLLFIPLGILSLVSFALSLWAWHSGRTWNRQYSGV